MRLWISMTAALLAASCTGQGSGIFGGRQGVEPDGVSQTVPQQRPDTEGSTDIGGTGQTADNLDQTSTEERQAALQPSAGGSLLGETVASLGDPGSPGFWLKTPLVQDEAQGRIEAADGTSLSVTLIPISDDAGAGSEMSLAAMRALGLSLTDLPNIKVFR